jgi:NAD(P)-dependent dehydrogenase (short-subunit alcohol dehydrogenase family)
MASSRFVDKSAVVTGAASGIGLAIARRLVDEGCRVVAADMNAERLATVVQELGEAAVPFTADTRSEAQVEAMVAAALERFGRLDLGFNCAGIGRGGEIADLLEEDWDATIDTTLKGVFLCVKYEARAMLRSGGGAIVNIGSLNGQVPMAGGGAYAIAKAGVEMLSRNAALELATSGIRVNTIAPGLTDTPATAFIHQVPDVEAAYMERIPMRRWARPEEIAAAALFLASDEAGYISGANLGIDGAWMTSGYPDLRRFR